MYLSLLDLFVVGLALDLVGAYLLARGLILSPTDIARLGTWAGVEVGVQVDRIRARIDASTGLTALFIGFGLQAVGYVLTLLEVEIATGLRELAAALVLALLAVAAWLWWWRQTREGRTRRLLVRVALAREGTGDPGDERRPGWTYRKAALLVRYGQGAGYPLEQDEAEHWERYADRVFGVTVRAAEISASRDPQARAS